ncbi:MAG: hypothetical protein ACRDY3_11270 [Acidimicrobiales bacterium]
MAAAQRAAGVLDELAAGLSSDRGMSGEVDPRALMDPRLLECKGALKAYPPMRVRSGCNKTLDWIAIAPLSDHGLQLAHGPSLTAPAQRRGGAYDIVTGVPTGPSGRGSAIGTVTWVQDAEAGVGHVVPLPDGPYGKVYGLKAHYRCPRCGREQTVLHLSLLERWLTAVIGGDREVRLGPLPGTAQVSKPKVERVADRQGAMAWSTRAARTKR